MTATGSTPTAPAERSLFARLGRFTVRRRWYVIAAWLLLLAVMGAFAPRLQDRLGSGGFEIPGSQSLAVQRDLERRFADQFPTTALVTVHDPARTVDDPAYRAVVEGVAARVRAVPDVGGVASWLTTGSPAFVSPDRHTTYLVAGLSGSQSTQLETAPEVAAAARRDLPAGVDVQTGGGAAFYQRLNEISRHDLEQAERVSFPITLVVLLLAFTSLVAAGLPVMLALVSLGVTLGALYFLAGVTDMNVYVTNTASIVGIGVGIDYALFVVTRFREELRRGRPVAEAVPATLATSGRAVALSGATVIVALAGMFLVDIQAFRSMAIGSMSVVAVAVLAAITLLPAVLSLVGGGVDRVRIPLPRRRAAAGDGFWHRWAVGIMRRPWAFSAVAVALLIALAVPFTAIRLGQPGAAILPADESPRLATERLAAEFGAGVTGPTEILVDTPGGAGTRANLGRVDRLTRALQADQAVASVQSLTTVLPRADLDAYARLYAGGLDGVDARLAPAVTGLANWDRGGDLARVTVVSRDAPESEASQDLVDRVRDRYLPAAGLAGQARVGGTTAFDLDLAREISGKLPVVVLAVLALSFVLLAMAFRSLVLPLQAIAMNLLSVGAAYGLIVAVFQWGWGERLLGFTSEGHIEVFVPLFLFSILFGLSMDYQVFLLSRIREVYLRTGDNGLAVARGLESTARTITSAALVMVTVFAAFAAGRLVPFKEMGFGLAVAVLIDATVVRTVLVPAVMRLAGRRNWWMPRAVDRWLPSIALESGGDVPDRRTRVPASSGSAVGGGGGA
jgi:RND superfamily putative drug exporter